MYLIKRLFKMFNGEKKENVFIENNKPISIEKAKEEVLILSKKGFNIAESIKALSFFDDYPKEDVIKKMSIEEKNNTYVFEDKSCLTLTETNKITIQKEIKKEKAKETNKKSDEMIISEEDFLKSFSEMSVSFDEQIKVKQEEIIHEQIDNKDLKVFIEEENIKVSEIIEVEKVKEENIKVNEIIEVEKVKEESIKEESIKEESIEKNVVKNGKQTHFKLKYSVNEENYEKIETKSDEKVLNNKEIKKSKFKIKN